MVALVIWLNEENLALIKSDLSRNLPAVKSSHRCEAIGRGLGFKTYAAARVASRSMPRQVSVNGRAFSDYLSEHGFHVTSKAFFLASAKAALRSVVARTPQLTMWGMGIGRAKMKPDGEWETVREMYARQSRAREELLTEGAEQFLLSLALLEKVERTKTIRPRIGSYGIKHIAENFPCNYPSGEKLGPTYVANGSLIAAALHAGFRHKTYYDELGYLDVNVSFNMSTRCLEDLDCEVRPNGARAQDRRARAERRVRFA